MKKTRRTLLLVAVLLLAVLVLSGCAMPRGNIDLNNPNGLWEAIVYQLAKLLIALHGFISGLGIGGSWGWSIVVFTIIIKVVTLPLTLKQYQSARATQVMQPRMRALQEKYGKDKQKLFEEQQKLYKELGVNPMGGCLPLLIQLPILWALTYSLYAVANAGQLTQANFLWIPDLSFPSLTVGMSWINEAFTANNWPKLIIYFSLPLLMLVTTLVQSKMAQPARVPGQDPDPQSRMTNQMMLFMPIAFTWFMLGLPSGVTLYWTISNILGVIQQYFVTGFGGLTDWFPFLPKKASLAVADSSASGDGNSSGSTRSAGVIPARSSSSGGSRKPVSASAGSSSGATNGSGERTTAASSRAADEAQEKPVKRKNKRRR